MNRKSPCPSVLVSRASPVAVCVNDTAAPATASEAGSFTVPTTVPVIVWAETAAAAANRNTSKRITAQRYQRRRGEATSYLVRQAHHIPHGNARK